MTDDETLDAVVNLRFATEEDRITYEQDLVTFGTAMLDWDGKHVPLNDAYLEPQGVICHWTGDKVIKDES